MGIRRREEVAPKGASSLIDSRIARKAFDDRAATPFSAGDACSDQLVERNLNAAQVGNFLLHKPPLLLGEGSRFRTVLANRQVEQQSHLVEREAETLGSLDEAQPVRCLRAVTAHRATRPRWLRHQTQVLVIADRLDVHARLLGERADFHGYDLLLRHDEGLDSVVAYGNKLTAVEAAPAKESRLDKSFQETAPVAIEDPKPAKSGAESFALAAGGIAALLAGACCVGPFVLVSAGLGGAWLASLQLFEPYRPVSVGIALAALGFAGWRIYRPTPECSPGQACATPQIRRSLRIGFWIVAALLLTMLGFPYIAPLLY